MYVFRGIGLTTYTKGSRRCYAFAEFQSDDDATDFLERHYPTIDISTPNGPHIQLHIEYSRERRPIANPDDWICAMVSSIGCVYIYPTIT